MPYASSPRPSRHVQLRARTESHCGGHCGVTVESESLLKTEPRYTLLPRLCSSHLRTCPSQPAPTSLLSRQLRDGPQHEHGAAQRPALAALPVGRPLRDRCRGVHLLRVAREHPSRALLCSMWNTAGSWVGVTVPQRQMVPASLPRGCSCSHSLLLPAATTFSVCN